MVLEGQEDLSQVLVCLRRPHGGLVEVGDDCSWVPKEGKIRGSQIFDFGGRNEPIGAGTNPWESDMRFGAHVAPGMGHFASLALSAARDSRRLDGSRVKVSTGRRQRAQTSRCSPPAASTKSSLMRVLVE